MKIVVKWRDYASDETAWRASFPSLFAPADVGHGATPEEAVRCLLKNAHRVVYRVPRSALTKRVGRLPDGDG